MKPYEGASQAVCRTAQRASRVVAAVSLAERDSPVAVGFNPRPQVRVQRFRVAERRLPRGVWRGRRQSSLRDENEAWFRLAALKAP
jgi:hypothetical protein